MIIEFVLVSFATVVAWEMVRSLVWFRINPHLGPFLVTLLAWGLTWGYTYKPTVLIAFAAAGGLALLHKIINAEPVDPIAIKIPRKPKPPSRGRRIPGI